MAHMTSTPALETIAETIGVLARWLGTTVSVSIDLGAIGGYIPVKDSAFLSLLTACFEGGALTHDRRRGHG